MADYGTWIDKTAYDPEDKKIGTVSDLYVDDDGSVPTWVAVKAGLFGSRTYLIPAQAAHETEDGLRFDVTHEKIDNAPDIKASDEISDEDESALLTYYAAEMNADGSHDEVHTGYDTSGPTTDDAMTRSEQEVHVATHTQEAGRMRLKKYVVSEDVKMTVPVEHEEVTVEREPITDENRGTALNGPELSEEEHEVVLHEQVADVNKVTVPKERVQLGKHVVSEERKVSETVDKEHINIEKE